ncbi:hypothetical protein B0O99DRAFT_695285 [Bisporella sp. PMI_857]|nr:hypothetical protein B0O99DRAFT_695285 [Bisporella sp. PMI_857]
MPEVTRVSRNTYRTDHDSYYSSDDDRSHSGHYRTVQRYRVAPSRQDDDDDRRSARFDSRLDLPARSERIEVDRRVERYTGEIDRPRSAVDMRPRSSIVERYVDRDEPDRREERVRTTTYERDRGRDSEYWTESRRGWEPEREVRETETRVEKRVERHEPREAPYEVERYQRETEYYDRPEKTPPPIIIRQPAPKPQQIIVQEAPSPPPIVVPQPQEQSYEIVRREVKEEIQERKPSPKREEDEYYYRKDVREVGPAREEREVAVYDRRNDYRDDRRYRDYDDRAYNDEDMVVTRRVVKERERSVDSHHKRHLAEGALAGAGAAALLANHRSKQGAPVEHRGRNVAGGAALGAIGAEVLTRARSRYREHTEGRSRSRSRGHPVVKTALGLAVAGIAAAAAAKYVKDRKATKEELTRGRSRTRSHSRRRRHSSAGSYSEEEITTTKTKSKHQDPKHQAAQIAKAGAATAAVAGVVNHFRNKSKSRNGERSKSRIRTGAEIAGAGLAGAAVAGLYENRKAKEEADIEETRIRKERRKSKSRNRDRSLGGYSEPDPELGMVQYGTDPVYTHSQTTTYGRGYEPYDPALTGAGAGAAYGHARERGHRRRDSSSSSDDHGRSRSRSRVRDFATAGIATGAAAIGVNEYKKRKERKEAERERERRRYEEEPAPENYYARDNYSPSPPHASGGSYYPENNQFPPPPTGAAYIPQNQQFPNDSPIPPYNPADYAHQHPHDPYGYPPAGRNVSRDMPSSNPANQTEMPYFPPPPAQPLEHEVNNTSRHRPISSQSSIETPPSSPEPQSTKSVNFAPEPINHPPPQRSKTSDRHQDPDSDSPSSPTHHHHHHRRHRRRTSDPSYNRPSEHRRHRRNNRTRSPTPSQESDEVEVLPDRFDSKGRLIEASSGGGQQEMAERLARSFGDVVEGRMRWRDLLTGLADGARR